LTRAHAQRHVAARISTHDRLWDIDNYFKIVKTVGASKGGINFSINGLCAVRIIVFHCVMFSCVCVPSLSC
jgi:hypothetical protein